MPQKISIITPSFNQAEFLEETIRSVLEQGYEPLEYLVIDGGSTDGSVEIIKRYASRLTHWISEKDRGQVDAINKGLKLATGDIVSFINSDDVYLEGSFAAVANYFAENPDCLWLCGDTIMFGEGREDDLISTRVPRSAAHCLAWAYKAPQPGHFWKRELLREGFDETWNYDFDHELYIRLLLAGHQCHHLPKTVAKYRLHAASKTVAHDKRFDEEFDRIAELYEPKLQGAEQRWSRSTRFLRRSYEASETGNRREAARWLWRAFFTYPEGISARPFWGCFRRLAGLNTRGRGPAPRENHGEGHSA